MLADIAPVMPTPSTLGFPLLTALVFVPAAGALLAMCVPQRRPEVVRAVGYVTSAAVFAMSLFLFTQFGTGATESGYQLYESHSWIGTLGIRWTLGVDGISLFMVMLTALLMPIGLLASARIEKAKSFTVWMLLLEAAMIGVFLALDAIVFFVFFEFVLVPMYFLIAGWGHGNRRYAAMKFFLFTMTGSAFLFVGILSVAYLYARVPGHVLTFDVRDVDRLGLRERRWRNREVVVLCVRSRVRREGAALPVPHLAPRRAHRRADGGLGRAGRRDAEDRYLRLLAVRDPVLPAGGGRPRADTARARRDRHHLRRDRRRDATEPQTHHRVLVGGAPRLRGARHVRADPPRGHGRPVHDGLPRPHHRRTLLAGRHAL